MDIIKLVNFFKFLKLQLNEMNKNIIRNRNLTFKDIFYFCFYKNGNSFSYSLTNYHMKTNYISNVSDKAFIKKRNTINFIFFEKINDNLLDYFYKYHREPRILAGDGIYLPVSINLKNYNYRTSKNETYCIVLNSCLFDINNKLVINYHLCKNYGE